MLFQLSKELCDLFDCHGGVKVTFHHPLQLHNGGNNRLAVKLSHLQSEEGNQNIITWSLIQKLY